MEKKTLEKGILYAKKDVELLPIHHASDYYDYDNELYVIADGENFVACETDNGKSALHVHDYRLSKYKKANGDECNFVRGYKNVIVAEDNNINHYFEDERACEVNGFGYSLRLKRFAKKEDRRFYGDEHQLAYHTHQGTDATYLPKFHNDSDEWLLGVEIEKDDSDMCSEGVAYQMLQETGWCKERDGSLGSYGYEMVSPILPLFDNNRILEATKGVERFLNGKVSSKCGGHMNISNKHMSVDDLMKNFKPLMPFFYALYPKRTIVNYSQAKKWRDIISSRNTKYSALFKKSNCVELRIPHGCRNVKTLMWRVELMQILLSDIGNNFNQYMMKLSTPTSKLHQHYLKQYDSDKMKEKVQLTYRMAQQYQHGSLSPSVKQRICTQFQDNDMFNQEKLNRLYDEKVYNY
jgi:hypothetical protein